MTAGWCKENKNTGDDLWEAACNPKSKMYGSFDLAVDTETGEPVRKSSGSSVSYDDGILCEVNFQVLWATSHSAFFNSLTPSPAYYISLIGHRQPATSGSLFVKALWLRIDLFRLSAGSGAGAKIVASGRAVSVESPAEAHCLRVSCFQQPE